jgi:peptidoglycan L-alanyl-D-glutamate endopeptidase CwlK
MSNPETVNRDLKLLHPLLHERFEAALTTLSRSVPGIRAFETYRSLNRQAFLFAKGRTTEGPIVTKATPGYSWHSYGLAVDVAVYTPADPDNHVKANWSWDFDKELVKEAMLLHGLELGPPFEACHFQLTGGLKIEEAYQLTRSHGMLELWLAVLRATPPLSP